MLVLILISTERESNYTIYYANQFLYSNLKFPTDEGKIITKINITLNHTWYGNIMLGSNRGNINGIEAKTMFIINIPTAAIIKRFIYTIKIFYSI